MLPLFSDSSPDDSGLVRVSLAKAQRLGVRTVGGRTVEMTETEYVVRGHGYVRGIADLEQIVLKSENGTPVLLRDVARVEIGPDELI